VNIVHSITSWRVHRYRILLSFIFGFNYHDNPEQLNT
jgi:hypothetical protein